MFVTSHTLSSALTDTSELTYSRISPVSLTDPRASQKTLVSDLDPVDGPDWPRSSQLEPHGTLTCALRPVSMNAWQAHREMAVSNAGPEGSRCTGPRRPYVRHRRIPSRPPHADLGVQFAVCALLLRIQPPQTSARYSSQRARPDLQSEYYAALPLSGGAALSRQYEQVLLCGPKSVHLKPFQTKHHDRRHDVALVETLRRAHSARHRAATAGPGRGGHGHSGRPSNG